MSRTSVATGAIVVFCVTVVGGCGRGQPVQNVSQRTPASPADSESPAATDSTAGSGGPSRSQWVLSASGFADLPLCAPLSAVASFLPSAKDTTYEDEGQEWPAKVGLLPGGQLIVESSWTDTASIWRITVTTPRIHTERGYRVGMLLDSLVRAGEPIAVEDPAGLLSIRFERERLFVGVDSAAQEEFLSRHDVRVAPRVSDIPRGARIAELTAATDCTQVPRIR